MQEATQHHQDTDSREWTGILQVTAFYASNIFGLPIVTGACRITSRCCEIFDRCYSAAHFARPRDADSPTAIELFWTSRTLLDEMMLSLAILCSAECCRMCYSGLLIHPIEVPLGLRIARQRLEHACMTRQSLNLCWAEVIAIFSGYSGRVPVYYSV